MHPTSTQPTTHLSGLQKRNLWWHHPPEQVTEPELIAEGKDQLALPVQAPRVSVVVLSCWDVFHELPSLQRRLRVLVKPRLEPPPDLQHNKRHNSTTTLTARYAIHKLCLCMWERALGFVHKTHTMCTTFSQPLISLPQTGHLLLQIRMSWYTGSRHQSPSSAKLLSKHPCTLRGTRHYLVDLVASLLRLFP